MAVKIEFVFFWVVVPFIVVIGYQRFRGLCCLHLHGSTVLQNVGILSPHCMVEQPRKLQILDRLSHQF
jgi:hypothetical protein